MPNGCEYVMNAEFADGKKVQSSFWPTDEFEDPEGWDDGNCVLDIFDDVREILEGYHDKPLVQMTINRVKPGKDG